MKVRINVVLLVCMVLSLGAMSASAQIMVYHPETTSWSNWGTNADGAIGDFNTTSTGRVLRFPPGEFTITRQITPHGNSRVISESDTTLIGAPVLDGTDMISLKGDGVRINNVHLSRQTNVRNSVTGNGINLNGKKYININDLVIQKQNHAITTTNGIDQNTLLPVWDVVIERVVLMYTKSSAVYLKGNSITVRSSKISNSISHGIEIYAQHFADTDAYHASVRIDANGIFWCNGEGIFVCGTTESTGYEGNKVMIQNNLVNQIYRNGVCLWNSRQVLVSGNTLRGAGTLITAPTSGNFYDTGTNDGWTKAFMTGYLYYEWGGNGIDIGGLTRDVTVSNNILFANSNMGVLIHDNGSTELANFIISGNDICGGTASYCGINGIVLQSTNIEMADVVITGNRIYNFFGGYPILQSGTCNRAVITGNNAYGNFDVMMTDIPIDFVVDHNIGI